MTLLDDRGHTSSLSHASMALHEAVEDELLTCAWSVGPDEKFDNRTDEDMADDHFKSPAVKLPAGGEVDTAGQEGIVSGTVNAIRPGPRELVVTGPASS